jgi:hypothetical protein
MLIGTDMWIEYERQGMQNLYGEIGFKASILTTKKEMKV